MQDRVGPTPWPILKRIAGADVIHPRRNDNGETQPAHHRDRPHPGHRALKSGPSHRPGVKIGRYEVMMIPRARNIRPHRPIMRRFTDHRSAPACAYRSFLAQYRTLFSITSIRRAIYLHSKIQRAQRDANRWNVARYPGKSRQTSARTEASALGVIAFAPSGLPERQIELDRSRRINRSVQKPAPPSPPCMRPTWSGRGTASPLLPWVGSRDSASRLQIGKERLCTTRVRVVALCAGSTMPSTVSGLSVVLHRQPRTSPAQAALLQANLPPLGRHRDPCP